ncbi:MAG: BMC domain-containing protein [bacterium]|nr:BMC domain-containing protein [bacterium]
MSETSDQVASQSLALLEFNSTAVGMLAVDRMLKKSPVALLRCGTVHPGRYLALVGGTVASCDEAYQEGLASGKEASALVADTFLPDPANGLNEALVGGRCEPEGDTLGVLEVSHSPGLLHLLDRVLKAVPVSLVEIRLADDLGGRALAIVDGELPDVQEVAEMAPSSLSKGSELLNVSVISRLDDTLRNIVSEGSHFSSCRNWKPAGCETSEDLLSESTED